MKTSARYFIVFLLAFGLIISGCADKKEEPKAAEEKASASEAQVPWNDFGYQKLDQFHVRYYYVFAEAIEKVLKGEMDWDQAIKDNTGIVEVWFKSDGSLFRLDRYIKKLHAKCKTFEGARPATISYNGKTYSLQERLVQKGKQFESFTFQSGDQTGYDDLTKQAIAETCRYEKFSSGKDRPVDQGTALNWMTAGHTSLAGFVFYLTRRSGDAELDEDVEDLKGSALELTKLMNPAEYKKILQGWKVKKKIAGRTAVKDYMSPPAFRGGATDGYQFIDLELGIGLEGYLEGCPKSWLFKETKFEEPKLTYKALLIEKTAPSAVFEKF
jgi:hypothetical protein